MNFDCYVDVLQNVFALVFDVLYVYAKTFQHDNASAHKFQVTMEFSESWGINVLNWSAKLSDLNIIENLWGALVREVYSNSCQFAYVLALQKSVTDSWIDIDVSYISNFYRSIPSLLVSFLQHEAGQRVFLEK